MAAVAEATPEVQCRFAEFVSLTRRPGVNAVFRGLAQRMCRRFLHAPIDIVTPNSALSRPAAHTLTLLPVVTSWLYRGKAHLVPKGAHFATSYKQAGSLSTKGRRLIEIKSSART